MSDDLRRYLLTWLSRLEHLIREARARLEAEDAGDDGI